MKSKKGATIRKINNRHLEILEAVKTNTLQQVANTFGVSRQRIGQITRLYGLDLMHRKSEFMKNRNKSRVEQRLQQYAAGELSDLSSDTEKRYRQLLGLGKKPRVNNFPGRLTKMSSEYIIKVNPIKK